MEAYFGIESNGLLLVGRLPWYPRQKREDGAPTVLEREEKPEAKGRPPGPMQNHFIGVRDAHPFAKARNGGAASGVKVRQICLVA
jgi:hypothetical protein